MQGGVISGDTLALRLLAALLGVKGEQGEDRADASCLRVGDGRCSNSDVSAAAQVWSLGFENPHDAPLCVFLEGARGLLLGETRIESNLPKATHHTF